MNALNNTDVIEEMISIMPDMAYCLDQNLSYKYCNTAYCKQLNKTQEEIIGKNYKDLFPSHIAKKLRNNDQKVFRSNKNESFEEIILNEKDEERILFCNKKLQLVKGSNEFLLLCFARDITQAKHKSFIYDDNMKLLEYISYENNLKKILDKIVLQAEKRNKDLMCTVLILSKNKKNLFGGSAPSIPSFYSDAVNGVEIGEKVGSCGSAAYKKERVIVENINTHENWQPFLAVTQKANLHSCWSEPIISSNNEILGTFAMYSNKPKKPTKFELELISTYAYLASVAIKRDAEETIIAEQSKLASLGEMIGNIAHQWRQPLSVISTISTGLIVKKELSALEDTIFLESCNEINNNAQYLSKTIDDFKSFLEVDKKKHIFNFESQINSFLRLMKGSIKTNDLNIILEVDSSITINNYENALTQSLINIFNNAKDALVQSDIEHKCIFITAFQDDNDIHIIIKDNAGGISEDVLPKIFEPYFTTKHKSQGTGLGLHMTYNLIISTMHGTIEAKNTRFSYESKKYDGFSFTIVLPKSH